MSKLHLSSARPISGLLAITSIALLSPGVYAQQGGATPGIPDITVSSSAGDAVIYEPFDYPVGGLNGQSGKSEKGFDGSWKANQETRLQEGSLNYSTLPTLGASIGSLAEGNRFGGSRVVSASALSANGLLNDGATLWFSAVMGMDEGGNVTNSILSLALSNNQFDGGKYAYWIADDGGQLGEGVGVTLGRVTDAKGRVYNGRAAAAHYQDISRGKGTSGVVYGKLIDDNPSFGSGEYRLIVGKITWGAGARDTIEIFHPAEDMALPGSPTSTLTVDVDQTTFDTITFARGDKVLLDEIRFGPTYRSVIGMPSTDSDTATSLKTQTGVASSGPSSLVVGEQIDLSSQNGVSADFNLSVNDNYAGYQGKGENADEEPVNTDATFNGPIVAYRFWNNPAKSSIGTFAQRGGIIGDVSTTDTIFTNGVYARIWESTDPNGNAFDTKPDFTAIVGDINNDLTGSVDISGLTSGSIYFIYGAYRNRPTLSLTMTGSVSTSDLSIDELHNGDSANNSEYYISRADFTNTDGYTTISYRFGGAGKGEANLRWSGVVVTELSATADYVTWISGYSDLGSLTALNDDADKDGILNGVENFFGTDPTKISGGLQAGASDLDPGTCNFTHPQSGRSASDLKATYRWSLDGTTYMNDGESFDGTTVTFSTQLNTPVIGTTTVTGNITGTPRDKLFVDVQVTQMP